MSILPADHTIYSFITLCLKEQGDISGRKAITTKHMGGLGEQKVECHHRQRHISVTGLRLRSRAWGWVTERPGCPAPTNHTCLNFQLYTLHMSPNCSTYQNLICDLSPDDQFDSAVQLPPCHHPEVTGRTNNGGGPRPEKAKSKGEAGHASPQSHEFLWTRQMLPHIF